MGRERIYPFHFRGNKLHMHLGTGLTKIRFWATTQSGNLYFGKKEGVHFNFLKLERTKGFYCTDSKRLWK